MFSQDGFFERNILVEYLSQVFGFSVQRIVRGCFWEGAFD